MPKTNVRFLAQDGTWGCKYSNNDYCQTAPICSHGGESGFLAHQARRQPEQSFIEQLYQARRLLSEFLMAVF